MSERPSPANIIRELSAREGSLDKLAERLGTSRQTVIRWLKGAEPNADYRVKLAVLADRAPADFANPPATSERETAELLQQAVEELRVMQAEVAEQLRAQSELLRVLAEVAARLEQAVAVAPPGQA